MTHVLAILSLLMGIWTIPAPKAATLTVQISNIEDLKGTLYVGIFKNGGDFPDDDYRVEGMLQKVSAETESVTINLPEGTYAVSVFHDVNENGELDTNFLGIPTEPYCFSQNYRPKLSAPDFKDCAFQMGVSDQRMTLELIQ